MNGQPLMPERGAASRPVSPLMYGIGDWERTGEIRFTPASGIGPAMAVRRRFPRD
jgi:DMSO/TMAO reductase YedYZ molybdopterin-dependent catalytic subunit